MNRDSFLPDAAREKKRKADQEGNEAIKLRRIKLQEWEKHNGIEKSRFAEEDTLDVFMKGIQKELESGHQQPTMQCEEEFDQIPEEDEEVMQDIQENKKLGKLEKIEQSHSSRAQYRSFNKNLYIEVPEIKAMTVEQVKEWRKQHDSIKIIGKACPNPILQFSQCGLADSTLNILFRRKFPRPTPIQCQVCFSFSFIVFPTNLQQR